MTTPYLFPLNFTIEQSNTINSTRDTLEIKVSYNRIFVNVPEKISKTLFCPIG